MGAPPLNVNQFVIEPSLGNMSIVLLFLVPMITMRLFAEEKRSGTLELLLTSPLRDYQIIVGKWFGALLLFACLAAGGSAQRSRSVHLLVPGMEARAGFVPRAFADGRLDDLARHLSSPP